MLGVLLFRVLSFSEKKVLLRGISYKDISNYQTFPYYYLITWELQQQISKWTFWTNTNMDIYQAGRTNKNANELMS